MNKAVDLSNVDYRIMRLQQLVESHEREISSLTKRLADVSWDRWQVRGNLEALTRQESIVLNPQDKSIRHKGAYGMELVMDLYGCDPTTFTRDSLGAYFDEVCALIGVIPEQRHFWDDLNVAPADRQTNPKTQGTSGVQFIITSTVVVHTLDQLRQVFVNVFSCKVFDQSPVIGYTLKHFSAACMEPHVIIRG